MKPVRFVLMSVFLVSLFTSTISARDPIVKTINLATSPKSVTESVEEGVPISVQITNIIKSKKKFNYSYVFDVLTIMPEPLKMPKIKEKFGQGKPTCQDYVDEAKIALDTANNEKEVAKIVSDLEKEINRCTNDESARKNYLDQIEKETTLKPAGTYNLKKGQKLVIKITRMKIGNDKPEETWEITYTTGEPGNWLVSYGFALPIFWSRPDDVFLEKGTNANEFIVTKNKSKAQMDFVPGVFFHYLLNDKINNIFHCSITGGLGFNAENPVVFLGVSGFYYQNLGISIGAAVHRMPFLKSKYHENQVIAENLENDQLIEKQFRINPYISIQFRFNENPFGSSGDKKKE